MEDKETRVLVADDDASIRELLCTLVRREGLTADCAADGIEALALLKEYSYKVILLDLMMPRMDGFAVIEHLKSQPQSDRPTVLVITAYTDQTFRNVDSEIVAGVIRKPFEVREIGELVRICATASHSRLTEILTTTSDRIIRSVEPAAPAVQAPTRRSDH